MLKSNRRCVVASLSIICAMLIAVTSAQQTPSSNPRIADLQEQLEKGLRARRQIEFQFVTRVVQLVNQGRLTREVVQGTFSFVTKKYQDRKYLVPIFEQALRKRLSEDGNSALNNVPSTLIVAR